MEVIEDKTKFCVQIKSLSWLKKHCFFLANGNIYKNRKSYTTQLEGWNKEIYIYSDEADLIYTNVTKTKGGFVGHIGNDENNAWTDIPYWAVKEVMTIKSHPEYFI